jgi:hypothetical protein
MSRVMTALSRDIGSDLPATDGSWTGETPMRRNFASISVVVGLWLLAMSASPALSQDYRVVSYQKTVEGLVSNWAAAVITLESKLVPVLNELEQKQAIQNPTDEDKARIDQLVKQRDDLSGQIDSENDSLRLELLEVEVQPGAPERELIELPDWLTGIIKAKGVPVGHGITLVPDASFDLKTLKLKSFSVGLRFSWG